MSYVDHVRVHSIRGSIECGQLSAKALDLLKQIADRALPPILMWSAYDDDDEFFDEALVPVDEFASPYLELDNLRLVTVDECFGQEADQMWWVSLRLAWDLPERGEGLL